MRISPATCQPHIRPRPAFITARSWSKVIVESYGYEWPAVLDEDFPGNLSTTYPPKTGVYYRSQYVNGYPYMSLSPKSTEPTPLQARAIEILTHTFPLLSSTYQPIYCPTWMIAGMTSPSTLSGTSGIATGTQAGNARPAGAANQPAIARPQLPNFPYRAFAVPFLMLCLRTLFLLYIFSPARKPIFAILLTAWLVWELWAAAQGVLAEERAAGRAPAPPGAPRNQNNRNGNPANGNAVPNGPQPPNGPLPNRANQNPWAPQQAVDRLAGYHIREEDTVFNAPEGSPAARPPSIFARFRQAIVLFVLTMHPEVWNRRRRTLREREGRVKRELAERRRQREQAEAAQEQNGENESNDDNSSQQPNANEQQQQEAAPEVPVRRRAPWLEGYIERVERAEWIDG